MYVLLLLLLFIVIFYFSEIKLSEQSVREARQELEEEQKQRVHKFVPASIGMIASLFVGTEYSQR